MLLAFVPAVADAAAPVVVAYTIGMWHGAEPVVVLYDDGTILAPTEHVSGPMDTLFTGRVDRERVDAVIAQLRASFKGHEGEVARGAPPGCNDCELEDELVIEIVGEFRTTCSTSNCKVDWFMHEWTALHALRSEATVPFRSPDVRVVASMLEPFREVMKAPEVALPWAVCPREGDRCAVVPREQYFGLFQEWCDKRPYVPKTTRRMCGLIRIAGEPAMIVYIRDVIPGDSVWQNRHPSWALPPSAGPTW